MAESRDYDELLFAWQGWRNASGRELRNSYKRYVELANLAAKSNGKCLKIKHFLYEYLLRHGTAGEKIFLWIWFSGHILQTYSKWQ